VVGGRDGKLVCYSGGLDAMVGMDDWNAIHEGFSHKAYPNPFIDNTVITFKLEQKAQVNITVYDLTGRKVADITNNRFDKGIHEITWSYPHNNSGAMTFYYTISVDGKKYSGKMIKMP